MSYKLAFDSRVKKDFANIGKKNSTIIMEILSEFARNFNYKYEQELLKTTKIKALKALTPDFIGLELALLGRYTQKKMMS